VKFKPGRLNAAADALSCRDEEPLTVHTLSILEFDLYDQFRQEVVSLPIVVAKHGDIEVGTTGDEWMVVDDMVLHKGCIFMSSSSAAWPLVLEQAHGMGHEGRQSIAFMPHSIHLKLQSWCKTSSRGCPVCQRNKTKHLHPGGLLQPLTIPSSVWADIAMNFVEGFPKAGGKSVILTVVDRFSKYAHVTEPPQK
jgi:hypothetical protein